MKLLKWTLSIASLLALAGAFVLFGVLPDYVGREANQVSGDPGAAPSTAAQALHDTLIVGDLHADTALWSRSLTERGEWGQVDIPRLIEGNFALQMFTTVTKSPRGQNYDSNSAEAADNITLLAFAQRWPGATRNSLTARALYQAQRIQQAAAESPHMMLVVDQSSLAQLLAARVRGEKRVGALIGTEGSHALDGSLDNIALLFDAGFRMMSLQHFFDNKLGGSLHGESNQGLTEFGRRAVQEMSRLGIMIDVAHSSEAVVHDVLDLTSDTPLIVSHTGFKGHCDRKRNISDATMQRIADAGGLIGVGFWEEAVCGESVDAIVGAIRYGIDTFGVDHIALGSDWDGSVHTPIDAAMVAHLTQGMLSAGFTETEISAVMGGNMLRFLQAHLPD